MHCPKCDCDNREGAKFCNDCGTPLLDRCAVCGALNPPDARFCDECGAALSADETNKAEHPASARPPSAGERRHLTVLFCDLVGSTEIAAQLDPEEWRELVARYHRAAAEAITRYGGHVAQYLGDGVMAYFGWPSAHDNDAECATRAGLAIVEAVPKLNHETTRPQLQARVGIDSGSVVVVARGDHNANVFGEAPNIAARVQAAAAPGWVMVTAATHRLISGLFLVEAAAPLQLKGVPTAVELFQVVRPTGVRRRLAAAHVLTPFIGREEELRLLLSRWERTRDGEGQLALVAGEAGIGKSRLITEFKQRIRDAPHIWMEGAGEQFFENSPFYALTEMLSEWLQLQGAANSGDKLARLELALAAAGLKLDEAMPLVAELLQLPVAERYPASTLVPEQKRRRLFSVLIRWVFGAARLQPLVIVVEDLHWLDPSTLELLRLLAEQGATVPLMLLYTARPEFRVRWPMRAHHVQITLNRLSARDVRHMVALVAARSALASASVDTVIERTGGVPLFVEELTRALLESGQTEFSRHQIPVTLHDSLMARLDRAGTAKEIIQLGAVIGAEFSYELLRALHPMTELELQAALRKLTDAELLYVRGILPEAAYAFKHSLIRDAAYEALLKSQRKELHSQVAHTIDDKFPPLKEAHPEMLARHWTEAGEIEPAIAEWQRAGKLAESRNAPIEARESYQQAISLLMLQQESSQRNVRELELRTSIVRTLLFSANYTGPETAQAIEQAALLAEKSGSLKQLIDLMIPRAFAYTLGGSFRAGGAFADRALELALREGTSANIGRAHGLQMLVRFMVGDLAGVEERFIAGLKFFEDPDFLGLPLGALLAFGHASWNAWTLGRADVAREREARLIAAGKTNPYGRAWSAWFAAALRLRLREYEQVEELTVQALKLAEQHQFTYLGTLAPVTLGDARSRLGRVAEGIELIRRGIAGMLEIGARLHVSAFTASLAAALERDGSILEALETIEQALQVSPDELVYRPEILQRRGELRLKQGQKELAEADFCEAIALAQRMSAKAYELRATMSLVRLLAQQSRRNEARTMLAETYNSFSEGFDTADLKEAKTLLDSLS